jgi:nicotinamidase/pyrazinamidase
VGKKLLIVVDVQKDFVDGALGTKEAQQMLPALEKKLAAFDGQVIFTKDTHQKNYMETQEGKGLPVPHCIVGTPGWQLVPSLQKWAKEHSCQVFEKPTFGSVKLAAELVKEQAKEPFDYIELVGLCTDICVISNALLLKANMPEVVIKVDPACCAGVTPEKHKAALEVMRSCQIVVE